MAVSQNGYRMKRELVVSQIGYGMTGMAVSQDGHDMNYGEPAAEATDGGGGDYQVERDSERNYLFASRIPPGLFIWASV